jgi:hypothetical protein
MRIDIANTVHIGDIVYNCFMEPLKVIERTDLLDDPHSVKFKVKDPHDNDHDYDSNDLYLEKLDDESDEEKSWVDWAKDNKDFFELFDHISTMKEIYKIGFANGFEYKRQLKFMEAIQK